MPYSIRKRGTKYCVFKKDSGKMIPGSCHIGRREAVNQMTAINLSEAKQKGKDVPAPSSSK